MGPLIRKSKVLLDYVRQSISSSRDQVSAFEESCSMTVGAKHIVLQ